MLRTAVRATIATTLLWSAVARPAAAEEDRTTHYTVDHQSSIVGFTVSARVLFTIHRDGQFREFSGDISYDPSNPAATHVDLTVYTASVNLEDAQQEDLLRSDEFFDVTRHPTMHFVSTAVSREADGRLTVTGDLTIRGIKKQLIVPLRVLPLGTAAGAATFETTFQIDRTEFGLAGGGPRSRAFKVSIGKKVAIHLAIAAHKTTAGVTP
jgi:polyisoprenoid-binding protein YceI